MPSENRLIDDFTKLTGDIVYTMLDAKKEMDRNLHDNIYQLIANVDQVTQEQFNALRELLENAQNHDNPMQQFMEEIQTQFNTLAGAVASPASEGAKPKAKPAPTRKKSAEAKPAAKKKSIDQTANSSKAKSTPKKAAATNKQATKKSAAKSTAARQTPAAKQSSASNAIKPAAPTPKMASKTSSQKSSTASKQEVPSKSKEAVSSDNANAAAGVDTKPEANPIVRNSAGNVTSLNPSLLVSSDGEGGKADAGSQTKK